MGAACCNVVWPARLVAMRRLPSSAHTLPQGARIARTQQRIRQHVGGWFLRLTRTALHALATPCAVAAAVLFLGENFTWINGMGLLVLILGV